MPPISNQGNGFFRAPTSLFVRLFLSFFLVSALVLVATFYVTQRAGTKLDTLASEAPQVLQDLLNAYRHGGSTDLDGAHDTTRRTLRINSYLVLSGINLGSRPMPAIVRERLGELRIGQEARFKFDDGGIAFALPARIPPTGAEGHALLFSQQEGGGFTSRRSLIYLQLLALLCAAGIVGWLVARTLIAPIRRMQTAVNLMASGNLSSRLRKTLNSGVTELETLAGDIDNMALQMQTMIASRDRLLHHLSHEMRSPLARLRILLEMLRDNNGSGDSSFHDRLNKADSEVGRLDFMIDEILGLARFDVSKPPTMMPLSIREIIEGCIDFTTVEAEAASVHLSPDLDDSDASDMVYGNRELIVRAVDNLLRNAIRYTPANHVVTIALRSESDSILLSISDQGPGVPQPYLQAIFEPFFRLRDTKSISSQNQQKGYGLGLTYVNLIAKLHGATIVASNNVSGGLLISLAFRRLATKVPSKLAKPD
jgi:two-component system, OmpR family, sensor kinase